MPPTLDFLLALHPAGGIAGAGAGTGVATGFGPTDGATIYTSVSGICSVTVQVSADNVNYQSAIHRRSGTAIGPTSLNTISVVEGNHPFIRINVTTFTSSGGLVFLQMAHEGFA